MVDKIQKTFKETLNETLKTDKMHEFRLCIGEKDNISIAPASRFFPVCPADTKKIVDIIMRPDIVK